MSAENIRNKLIHLVMVECYEQGIEEGKKQAVKQIKALKEQNRKLRVDKKQLMEQIKTLKGVDGGETK